MKIKDMICVLILVGIVGTLVNFFPIKRITFHDRRCIVMISRIYPVAQQGDYVITKDGKVKGVKTTSANENYYGRIIFSTTEGLL